MLNHNNLGANMESYIVRIYRRDKDDAQKIAGRVENVSQEENREFTSTSELLTILSTLPLGTDFQFRAQ